MKYHCENCGNKKANDIIFNVNEIGFFGMMVDLVNTDNVTFEQLGIILHSLFYKPDEDEEE
jgi:hypothetical protein|tara:strand:+ start:254 stop:436 length:183 start_codon:yes stop_codon:yes gene_type:complete